MCNNNTNININCKLNFYIKGGAVVGIIKDIADQYEPIRLAKEVENDVVMKGLELNVAIRKAKEKMKKGEALRRTFRGRYL